jgi:hypothetical protein
MNAFCSVQKMKAEIRMHDLVALSEDAQFPHA